MKVRDTCVKQNYSSGLRYGQKPKYRNAEDKSIKSVVVEYKFKNYNLKEIFKLPNLRSLKASQSYLQAFFTLVKAA